jgi:hypothetical protein
MDLIKFNIYNVIKTNYYNFLHEYIIVINNQFSDYGENMQYRWLLKVSLNI